jgi:integrase
MFRKFLNRDISFQEIDEPLLRKYKAWLQGVRGVSERTCMNYFISIRTLYNRAIAGGIVEQKYYPFGKGKIQIKFPQTIKIGLEANEIIDIENLELEKGTTIWHTRNVFLFSFYFAGIRISDVLRMRWKDFKNDRLYYKMNKNNKVDSLKIPKKVYSIIESYKEDKKAEADFIFPELKKARKNDKKDEQVKIKTAIKKFNHHLTEIARLAEIDKNITTHIARHSFGNIAGDKVSPQMLQKLYRHTNLSTTIGYQGNFIHKDADDALDSVVDF